MKKQQQERRSAIQAERDRKLDKQRTLRARICAHCAAQCLPDGRLPLHWDLHCDERRQGAVVVQTWRYTCSNRCRVALEIPERRPWTAEP